MSAQANGANGLGNRITHHHVKAQWVVPRRCLGPPRSGLDVVIRTFPRAMPWACMGPALRAYKKPDFHDNAKYQSKNSANDCTIYILSAAAID